MANAWRVPPGQWLCQPGVLLVLGLSLGPLHKGCHQCPNPQLKGPRAGALEPSRQAPPKPAFPGGILEGPPRPAPVHAPMLLCGWQPLLLGMGGWAGRGVQWCTAWGGIHIVGAVAQTSPKATATKLQAKRGSTWIMPTTTRVGCLWWGCRPGAGPATGTPRGQPDWPLTDPIPGIQNSVWAAAI